MTHITYETAKMLKAFLGDKAPEPMKGEMGTIWIYDPECPDDGILQGVSLSAGDYPAYQLHDLLSKPFCEAFIKERFARGLNSQSAAWEIVTYLEMVVNSYYSGGLPAVEKSLTEMMEGK